MKTGGVIRIKESDIRRIVKDSIEKVLFENDVPAKTNDDIFDLTSFSKEMLKQNYVSYSPYRLSVGHGSVLQINQNGEFLIEGIDYEANAEKAKEDITKHFPIDVCQFIISEGSHGLAILVANIKGNIEIIKGCMAQHNFFPSRYAPNLIELSIDGQEWVDMRFEPIEQDDVTDKIRKENNVLYHLSPSIFENSILQKGLLASNSNPVYKYPTDRLHLIEEHASSSDIKRLASELYAQAKMKGITNLSPEYTLFSIDLSKVPDGVRFYEDINEKFGLFTVKKITRNAIQKVGTVTVK